MNIKLIRQAINSKLGDELTKMLIIDILAKDKDVIHDVLQIIAREREVKTELITELNFELSRAETGLDKPELNKDRFMNKEIKKFYIKYQDHVGHCFKNYGKLDKPENEGLF